MASDNLISFGHLSINWEEFLKQIFLIIIWWEAVALLVLLEVGNTVTATAIMRM